MRDRIRMIDLCSTTLRRAEGTQVDLLAGADLTGVRARLAEASPQYLSLAETIYALERWALFDYLRFHGILAGDRLTGIQVHQLEDEWRQQLHAGRPAPGTDPIQFLLTCVEASMQRRQTPPNAKR